MRMRQETIEVRTPGRGLHEVSRDVAAVVGASGVRTGICVIACLHTSCSLLVQENADPSARRDLERFLERIAPEGDPRYEHVAEGADDSPSHLRAALTSTSETLVVRDGALALGTWQGIYLAEHRARPHVRRLLVHVMGD